MLSRLTMRRLTIPLLLLGALAAQPPLEILLGKVVSAAADRITVESAPGATTVLYTDSESHIWRGQTGNSLSAIRPGDEVSVRYRLDAHGRRTIVDLWANIEHIWGRIARVGSGEFEVDQNYDADPQSAYKRQLRQVSFDADTQFQGSAPEDLRPGRDVDVIGLDLGSPRVRATRVIVYEGKAPVRLPPGARVIAPNGAPNGTVRNSK